MKTQSKQHQPLVLTKSTFLKIAVFLGVLLFSIVSMASTPVPPYSAQVVDLTNTLSQSQKEELIQNISDFEQNNRSGAQLAVLIVPTTEEESIEQFATRVFDNWKIGKKNRDNGALLLIAKNDRTLRIEVGYGLEGAITDVTSGRIIRNTILPQFQQNNYFAGIQAGVSQLTALINQEITADDIAEEPDVEGYITQFLFMSVYVSAMVYVVFSGLQRKIRRILPPVSPSMNPTSIQNSPSTLKTKSTLSKKMRWGHYILSILGLNGVMFLFNASNSAMLTPVVILLTILASFVSCGIASLFLNNFIQPGQSMQGMRGQSRRGGGRGGFGGGGFGGGGFGGGGGGRSGGGGASGRW